MTRFTVGFILLVLTLAGLIEVFSDPLSRWFPFARAEKTSPLVSCQVLTVYDGDTFGCDLNGNHKIDSQEEHVRMLGIHTPEMHYSRKNTTGKDQPGALAATEFLRKTLLNKPVYLEFDRERFDTYDRTLAYAYLDPGGATMVNTLMLEKGLATILFLNNNRRYAWLFEQVTPEPAFKKPF